MRRTSTLTIALAILVVGAPASAAPAAIDSGTVGAPGSNARAELFLPSGSGPFPAMVVLHGCDGVGPHYRDWARDLAAWGYVALLVDSFRPRGYRNLCNHGMDVPPLTQAQDGFDGAAYLRGLTNVRADRIGVIGFSHGGWAALKAVLADTVQQDRAVPFAAAIAFYPGCDPPGSPLATDTLILIGDADDWTPAARCEHWRNAVETAGHALSMKIYRGALHGFDAKGPPRVYAGHHVGRDPEAAADAAAATRDFLAARLTGP
jgi:dienelactone hydrolase